MRKFLIGAAALAALGLAACGDDPHHHPMHYAKLYTDSNQHMYTYTNDTWWLFNPSTNSWAASTRPSVLVNAAYANASTGKSSSNAGLVEVKDGRPQNEEFEGTQENLEGAEVDDVGATVVAPSGTGGGSNATDSPAPQEPTQVQEAPSEPNAAPTPEAAPEAPSEGGGESSPSDAGGGSDGGGGSD
jgi:hypothetical protein